VHELVHAANFNNYNIPQRRNISSQTICSNATNIKAVDCTVFYVRVTSNLLVHKHYTEEQTMVGVLEGYTHLTHKPTTGRDAELLSSMCHP
jgi:hypothetical protein